MEVVTYELYVCYPDAARRLLYINNSVRHASRAAGRRRSTVTTHALLTLDE